MPNIKPKFDFELEESPNQFKFNNFSLAKLKTTLLEEILCPKILDTTLEELSRAVTGYLQVRRFERGCASPAEIRISAIQFESRPIKFDENTNSEFHSIAEEILWSADENFEYEPDLIERSLEHWIGLRFQVMRQVCASKNIGRMKTCGLNDFAQAVSMILYRAGVQVTNSSDKSGDQCHTGQSTGAGLYHRILECLFAAVGEDRVDISGIVSRGSRMARLLPKKPRVLPKFK
jgi:hypothetical protein